MAVMISLSQYSYKRAPAESTVDVLHRGTITDASGRSAPQVPLTHVPAPPDPRRGPSTDAMTAMGIFSAARSPEDAAGDHCVDPRRPRARGRVSPRSQRGVSVRDIGDCWGPVANCGWHCA
jgi:hypothetical protein